MAEEHSGFFFKMCVQKRMKTGGEMGQTGIELVRKKHGSCAYCE